MYAGGSIVGQQGWGGSGRFGIPDQGASILLILKRSNLSGKDKV